MVRARVDMSSSLFFLLCFGHFPVFFLSETKLDMGMVTWTKDVWMMGELFFEV